MTLLPGEFAGTTRFEVLRRLGSGGFGVVFSVHDRERDERVALKTLRWADPAAIYRLKKEFRSLADVVHPNLVGLYELIAHDEQWFFTMEHVSGVEFTEFVRTPELSVERLRSALRQTVEGVAAIHAAGKLHRDLKPSNVLVTPEGRAVILDFGVVGEMASGDAALETADEGAMGTAAYMAPEQVSGQAGAPADWYALGTMLYEALTGRLPYAGTAFVILSNKHTVDPVAPQVIAPGVPADLAELCLRLLARNAADRPGYAEILRALGEQAPTSDRRPRSLDADLALVGREFQLAALTEAFTASGEGEAVSIYVQGPSGIGKSTLVQRFVDDLARTARALPLTGRCFVRETVPYKGFDGVIDALSRYLRALSPEDLDRLLPADVAALTRLFPVLARVEGIEALLNTAQPAHDPVDLRLRAFGALRAMLGRIRSSRPVVIWIDDFQWADVDTLLLLNDLMSEPDPPSLLVVASFRSEERDTHPLLRALLERAKTGRVREVTIEPFSEPAARHLARVLLGDGEPEADARADARAAAIAREAGGSPFLVEQLVAHSLASGEDAPTAGVSLAEMLEARLARLPEGARGLLEVVATAGRPIGSKIALEAAGTSGEVRPLLMRLGAEHLLRATSTVDQIELYHDRLRETLTAQLDRERLGGLHLRLAHAMEAHGADDPEALYEHFAAAGRRQSAAEYARRSAQRAESALAFERAALFYQRAIELADGEGDARDLTALRIGLADALANAGRGPEAADVYLTAAGASDEAEALRLRRRAAEELLRSGHVDRGLAVLETVLRAVGLRLARSPRTALLQLIWRRARLRLRGLAFTERAAEDVDALALRRMDVCWGVATGLGRVDKVRAETFQSLGLLLALKAGEPYRIARALAAESAFFSTAGESARERAAALERVTRALAERVQHPHALGLASFAEGIARFFTGRFAEARPRFEDAEAIFRGRCTGVAWEINTSQTYSLSSLCFLGEWGELTRRVPLRLREARERGDLYAAADVAAGRPNLAWLVADDVAGARAVQSEAMDRWSRQGFHFQRYVSLIALGQIDLYVGEGESAWSRVSAHWSDVSRAMMMRLQMLRVEMLHLRARSALAAAREPSRRQASLESASRDARRLVRERTAWARPLADLVLAGVAAMRHEPDAAALAERAVSGFELSHMAAHAAAARRRFGELTGGDGGATLVAEADAWMRSQGVVNVDRMTAMLAPGFPE